MCGLIGAFNYKENKEPVNNWVQNQLQDQLSRGVKGFGIIFIDEKKKVTIERATELTKPIIDLKMQESRSIILHHRTPTSTENKILQTHPLVVDHAEFKHTYLVIHNGIIWNEDEIKKEHETLGFKYLTEVKELNYQKEEVIKFNDSECVAIEVALVAEGKKNKIDCEGTIAFIALQIDKKTKTAKKVFFGRNDSNSPLRMSQSKNTIRINSEGGGQEVIANKLHEFNLLDFKLKSRNLEFKKREYQKSNLLETTVKKHMGYNYGQYDEKQWEDADYDIPPANTTVLKNENNATMYDEYGLPNTNDEELNEKIRETFKESVNALANAIDSLISNDSTEEDIKMTIDIATEDIEDNLTNLIMTRREIEEDREETRAEIEAANKTTEMEKASQEEKATVY